MNSRKRANFGVLLDVKEPKSFQLHREFVPLPHDHGLSPWTSLGLL